MVSLAEHSERLTEILKGENPQRILLIRSGQMDIVNDAVYFLKDSFPKASIEVLCQPVVAGDFRKNSSIDGIHLYDKELFQIELMEKEQLGHLRERKYDLVVVVYSNKRGERYYQVEHVGDSITSRHLLSFNCARQWNIIERPVLNKQEILFEESDKQIRALKDIQRGQRAFILGMGPSLLVSDIDRLKGEVTFACNKIYLAFDDTKWRPTYYSVIDLLVAQNNRSDICELRLKKIFTRPLQSLFSDESDIIYVRAVRNPGPADNPRIRFSKDILEATYGGHTVIYFQMQLAYYMGIREIYLLGVDFSFDIPKTRGEKTAHGEDVLVHSGEVNHFHPDYRKPGEKWSMPNLVYQYKAFQCAKEAFESDGGFIANASRSTKLDVFPLVDFDKIKI
jgi:hypothetical protein